MWNSLEAVVIILFGMEIKGYSLCYWLGIGVLWLNVVVNYGISPHILLNSLGHG